MRGNRVLAGVLLWLLAVVTVAGLAWFAIDSAGKSVTALPVSAPEVAGPSLPGDGTGPPDSAATSAPPTAAAVGSGPADPNATGVSTGVSTSRSAVGPATRSADPQSGTPGSKPPRSTTPAPRVNSWTRKGPWGSITITCAGDRAALQSARPADQWQVKHVSSSGPVKVEVEFGGRHGLDKNVEGTCRAGQATFVVEDA